jgi:hypothetical protein
MTTEFAIEWVGFTSSEKRQLKSRWARLRFWPGFCARFSGKVYKGDPGEPGGIWIYANDVRRFREHWSVGMDFPSVDELVRMAAEVVTRAAMQYREISPS